MMGEQQNEVRAVFLEALALTAPDERARYLDAACRDKPELRQRIEALLRAREQAGEFLRQDALGGDLNCIEFSIAEGPGTVIGRYKLLEQIGEGGFGVVFMAEQLEPIRRRVALKIVKPGMDTKQVIARFEAERQALALMDHPNIAHVFDAGATETGRPYFVMELVHGVPITQFCDANDLTPHERLKLFLNVCEAVQHAHQKGIIHRDLKPSNILVTLHDGKPVPKVIDFGTAKALQHPLTEKTLFTAYGKLIGTPQYMSPEQAELSGLDVDTRADIYALGVLLYELLTGTTPFEAEQLRTAAFEEMLRIIRQEEPPKPSTRVSTLGARATEIARHRQVDPDLLQRSLRGDLDWIVMKALEKDRARRYETANSLLEDIQRHLNHEPVKAGPPGAGYRTRKFIRRHRMAVAVTAVITCALAIGLTASLIGFAQARQERNRAVAAEAKAQNEAAIAEAINQFLQEDLLGQASAYDQPDRDVKLRTLLDRAAENVETRFQDKPLVGAEIRLTLSVVYGSLGEFTNARVHLDRALDIYRQRLSPEDPRLLKARRQEVCQLQYENRFPESQALVEQLLPLQRRVLGAEHSITLDAMQDLAIAYRCQLKLTEAQMQIEEVLSLRRRVSGVEHRVTLDCMLELAMVHDLQGRLAEAQKLQEEVLSVSRRRFVPHHSTRLWALCFLAGTYQRQGRLAEAQQLFEEALAGRRRALGPEHPDTLGSMFELASTLSQQGKWVEARKLYEEAVAGRQRALGLEHPDTISTMNDLAWLLATCAEAKVRDGPSAVRMAETVVVATSRTNDTYLDTLAAAYAEMGRFAEAASVQQEAIAVLKNPGWKKGFVSRLRLYEAGSPFREAEKKSTEPLR
jgi:eukaryotic-like serine/threonine-protein kinase